MPLPSISPSGVGTAFLYGNQSSAGTGYAGIISAPPPSVNTPIFYEPQPSLSQNRLILYIVVTAPQPNFGGAQVWASVDGTTYGQIGGVGSGGVQGVLTNSPGSGAGTTVSVDVSESTGTILAGSSIDANLGITLGYITSNPDLSIGELIGYTTATLTSSYNYNLNAAVRGMFGTTAAGHSAGDSFGLLNGGVFEFQYPQNLIGQTVFFKFPTFNSVGGGLQDLSGVTAYSYKLTGVGLSPSSGPGACPVITVLSGGACCIDLGSLGECISATCDLGTLGTPVTQCIDLGVLGT